jgi:hypothetical protein
MTTIYPKGEKEIDKLKTLRERLIAHIRETERGANKPVTKAAIEQYVEYVRSEKGIPRSLMANCNARGVILGVLFEMEVQVQDLDKGSVPKNQALIVTKKYFGDSTAGSEHSRDALLVGFLAGFGR